MGEGACEVQKRYLWKKLHAHHVTLTYIHALALKKIHIKEVLMRKFMWLENSPPHSCITFLMVTPKWFDSKYQSLSKIVPFRIIQGLSLRFHVEGYLPLVGGDLNN